MKRPEQAGPVLEFGPCRVDLERHLLWRDGRPVALKAKPFQILAVLLARRGEDVSRAELLRAVWPDTAVEENNLSQCISALRKALGEGPKDHTYIVTVPGTGYRFVAPVAEAGPGSPPAGRRSTRSRLALGGLAAALVVVAVAGAATLVHRQGGAVDTAVDLDTADLDAIGLDEAGPAAREAYLKGRFFWNKRTVGDLERALEYFDRALDLEPGLALAESGRADAHTLLWEYTHEWPHAVAATAAAERAFSRDPESAAVLTSRANIAQTLDGDLAAAERDFRRAIALDPGYATARHWYAWCLLALGRLDEATAELRRAQELEPLSPIITSALGSARYFAGDDQGAIDAIEQYRRALELDPGFVRAHLLLGQVLTSRGRYDDAIAELEMARDLAGGTTETLAALAYAYGRAGRRDDWEATRAEIERRDRAGTLAAYPLALAWAGIGDEARALEQLSRACHQRTIGSALRRLDPRLATLRRSPGFARACPPEPPEPDNPGEPGNLPGRIP